MQREGEEKPQDLKRHAKPSGAHELRPVWPRVSGPTSSLPLIHMPRQVFLSPRKALSSPPAKSSPVACFP